MNRYAKRVWGLAAALSAVAGYVDATAFLETRGFFVSFMSGNSTRLAVGAARGSSDAAVAAALVGSFVCGVVAGSLLGHHARADHRRPAILAMLTLLLALAASLGAWGFIPAAIACMAFAMGAENAAFAREGEVHIGLTYMTGTLVKLGQHVAGALVGGARLSWLPYLLLWSGLIAGAIAGAAAWSRFGLASLWAAAGATALLTFVAHRIGPDRIPAS